MSPIKDGKLDRPRYIHTVEIRESLKSSFDDTSTAHILYFRRAVVELFEQLSFAVMNTALEELFTVSKASRTYPSNDGGSWRPCKRAFGFCFSHSKNDHFDIGSLVRSASFFNRDQEIQDSIFANETLFIPSYFYSF